ncbi:hypothetical protein B0H16DRAFT_1453229 [Mycena metata]|uniref:Uncharacterized protein n=1 Tax=Mycena metata TaxID=1033252 RepID=A0AAD7JLQ0_9AGAR|nr:hypothetical protein B0H16DRAFT_1453229 [Mycena metata]
MAKKRCSKKPSPQKASNDSKEYQPGLSKEQKAERRRRLSAESAKKRRWDPAPKAAIAAPPAPSSLPSSSLPSSSVDGSFILPEATPSEYHRAWFDGLSEEPPSLSARSLSICAAAADVAKAGDIIVKAGDIIVVGGDHISLTSDEMLATQVLAGMAQMPKKISPGPSTSMSISSSGRLSLPRSTDRYVLLRPTSSTAPGTTRVGLGQALVAELNSGELTAPTLDDTARWSDHGGFVREEDWCASLSWQSLCWWRNRAATHMQAEKHRASETVHWNAAVKSTRNERLNERSEYNSTKHSNQTQNQI